jgi:hypothetical protein
MLNAADRKTTRKSEVRGYDVKEEAVDGVVELPLLPGGKYGSMLMMGTAMLPSSTSVTAALAS